jgi:nucleoside-diphosphate-sugar epimerase
MQILITGNMGYVGPAVVRQLRQSHPKAKLIGYDTGLFAHFLTGSEILPETYLTAQHFGDVRDIDADFLRGFDAVVHLAAISNDPMGNQFSAVTKEINQDASLRLARIASDAGVKSFVFASSCSVYGVADDRPRCERDPINPITAYARSKIGTEEGLHELETAMTVTCLRFATACGASERLRLDLVLNDFVAGALADGRITVLSDGTPWRPLIDIEDMALAIDWAIMRDPGASSRHLVVNVGSNTANYRVSELAYAVAEAVPGTEVLINRSAPADSRSYCVNFDLYAKLAPGHQPRMSLAQSIAGLVACLRRMEFADEDFRNSPLMRLGALQSHVAAGRLDCELRWCSPDRERVAA